MQISTKIYFCEWGRVAYIYRVALIQHVSSGVCFALGCCKLFGYSELETRNPIKIKTISTATCFSLLFTFTFDNPLCVSMMIKILLKLKF